MLMEIHYYLFVVPRYFLDAHGDTFLFVVVPRYFLDAHGDTFLFVVVPRYFLTLMEIHSYLLLH